MLWNSEHVRASDTKITRLCHGIKAKKKSFSEAKMENIVNSPDSWVEYIHTELIFWQISVPVCVNLNLMLEFRTHTHSQTSMKIIRNVESNSKGARWNEKWRRERRSSNWVNLAETEEFFFGNFFMFSPSRSYFTLICRVCLCNFSEPSDYSIFDELSCSPRREQPTRFRSVEKLSCERLFTL